MADDAEGFQTVLTTKTKMACLRESGDEAQLLVGLELISKLVVIQLTNQQLANLVSDGAKILSKKFQEGDDGLCR